MNRKPRIYFIINPLSGGIDKTDFPKLITQFFPSEQYEVKIAHTLSTKHNIQLAREFASEKPDVLVAVGGDGTVNHIAEALVGSQTKLAMVPMGSGNGLARHLNIPMSATKALKVIKNDKHVAIDTASANKHFFSNIAGVGFDAHIGNLFAKAGTRGFKTYAQLTVKEFSSYEPKDYIVTIDGKTMKEKAFLICVANGSQYGNNAHIAPTADITDGKLELIILKPFGLKGLPAVSWRIFQKNIHQSRHVDVYSGKKIHITCPAEDWINIDGEPHKAAREIDFEILPSSLQILVP